MPSSSITAGDCAGPAPPNDRSANSRGSMPRWMVICRIALAWFQLAISMMPWASCSALMLPGSRAASAAIPARARSTSSAMPPPIRRGGNAAEHQIGVGDGRLVAAVRVAHRSGLGAGAARSDLEMALAGDPGDRAAAGADGLDVDHRNAHREGADRAAVGDVRLAAFDQAEIGRGAAGVERHDVGKAGDLGDHRAAERAGRRSRQRRGDRLAHHLLGARDAAARLHDQERLVAAARPSSSCTRCR